MTKGKNDSISVVSVAAAAGTAVASEIISSAGAATVASYGGAWGFVTGAVLTASGLAVAAGVVALAGAMNLASTAHNQNTKITDELITEKANLLQVRSDLVSDITKYSGYNNKGGRRFARKAEEELKLTDLKISELDIKIKNSGSGVVVSGLNSASTLIMDTGKAAIDKVQTACSNVRAECKKGMVSGAKSIVQNSAEILSVAPAVPAQVKALAQYVSMQDRKKSAVVDSAVYMGAELRAPIFGSGNARLIGLAANAMMKCVIKDVAETTLENLQGPNNHPNHGLKL